MLRMLDFTPFGGEVWVLDPEGGSGGACGFWESCLNEESGAGRTGLY